MAVNILAVAQTEKVDLIANAILLHQLSQPGFRTSFSDKVDLYVFYPAFFQKGYGFIRISCPFFSTSNRDTCTIRMFFLRMMPGVYAFNFIHRYSIRNGHCHPSGSLLNIGFYSFRYRYQLRSTPCMFQRNMQGVDC